MSFRGLSYSMRCHKHRLMKQIEKPGHGMTISAMRMSLMEEEFEDNDIRSASLGLLWLVRLWNIDVYSDMKSQDNFLHGPFLMIFSMHINSCTWEESSSKYCRLKFMAGYAKFILSGSAECTMLERASNFECENAPEPSKTTSGFEQPE